MTDFSFLTSSNKRTPAPQYQLDGKRLLNGKFEVPLFWYILFAPHDIRFPKFEKENQGQYWYISQPPYLITTREAAVSRLKKRKKNLNRILSRYQKDLYGQFTHVIEGIEHSYLHLDASQITTHYEPGILKKHMIDLVHCFEQLESKPSTVDLLFSPIAYELGVNPKVFISARLAPKYFIRKFQHKYWEWKGIPLHSRDSFPLRDENSFVPPTQYNLVGAGEELHTPWE